MKIGKYDVTAKNIRSFIVGTANRISHDMGLDLLEDHEKIQVAMRSHLCNECAEIGACKLCHCTTPDMFYDPSKECEGRRWGKMLDKKSWEAFISKIKDKKMSIDDLEQSYSEYVEETGGEVLNGPDEVEESEQDINDNDDDNSASQADDEDVDDVIEVEELTVEQYLAAGPKSIVKSKVPTNVNDPRSGFIRFDDPRYENFTVYDFGRIPAGTPVEYEFSIPNNSGMSLRILQIKTSCSCSTATGDLLTEKPNGEFFKVKMQFDGKIMGKVIRSTEVTIEDMVGGHRQYISLFMKGEVYDPNI